MRVLDNSGYEVASPEPDGRGGLWITALDVRTSSLVFLRYDNGRLVPTAVPKTSQGATTNVSPPIVLTGTSSAWATGDVALSGGLSGGAVFKLGK